MRINQHIISSMKQDHQDYVYRVLQHIERSDVDVKALVLYGSSVNQTTYPTSDVDGYIYSDDPKGNTLNSTVMIKGVGYDVFCVNSEFLQNITDLTIDLLPLILDGYPVYIKDASVLDELHMYQNEAKKNLLDSEKKVQAIHRHKESMSIYRRRLLQSAHGSELLHHFQSWLYHFAYVSAYKKSNYFRSGVKSLVECLQETYVNREIKNELIEILGKSSLKESILEFMSSFDIEYELDISLEEQDKEVDLMSHQEVKEFFQELASYFRKVEHANQIPDRLLLFFYLCTLEKELHQLLPSIQIDPVDFLDTFRNHTEQCIKDVLAFELNVRQRLYDMGIILDEVECVADWKLLEDKV